MLYKNLYLSTKSALKLTMSKLGIKIATNAIITMNL